MPELWMPGAIRIIPDRTDRRGGPMTGSPGRYFTWHTFEGANVLRLSATSGARMLNAAGTSPTFCLHPVTGEVAQMLPANASCYTLENAPGSVETNRAGEIHMQAEVLAEARNPFTGYMSPAGWDAVARIVDFAESWGIPRAWPAGRPAATPGGPHNRIGPGPSGHYGHSQWRDQPSGHWDPGAVDTARILAATQQPAADPAVLAEQQTYNRALAGRPGWTPIPEDGIPGPLTTAAKEAYMTTLDDLAKQLDRIEERQRTMRNDIAALPRLVWGYVNPKVASSDVYGMLRQALGLVKDGKPVNPDGSPFVPGAGQ